MPLPVSMSELSTLRWTFEEDVRCFQAAGYDSMAVWRPKLTDFGEEKGADLLLESGMAVSSLHWAGGFTGHEGRSHDESIRDGIEAIELAASLRAGCLVLYSGARAGHIRNHAWRLFRTALEGLLPVAQEHGVALALKPMHPCCAADWTMLTDVGDTVDLVQSFDAEHLGIAFDTYHLGLQPQWVERLPELCRWIRIVQLGDMRDEPSSEPNRCQLLHGCVPLGAIMAQLVDAGYQGPVEIELWGEDVEPIPYDELLDHSIRVAQSLVAPQPEHR